MKILKNHRSKFSMFQQLSERLPKHTMIVDLKSHRFIHPVYNPQDLTQLEPRVDSPKGFVEKYAYYSVWLLKRIFDLCTLKPDTKMSERNYINRLIMLNSISAVPGFTGAMCRHLKSLRSLRKDYGWINQLIAESDNERMHLFFFLTLNKPNFGMKAAIFGAQFLFSTLFFASYFVMPRYCHKFMEYFQNRAVQTYTEILQSIESGTLQNWSKLPAPVEPIDYYELKADATMKDMILCVRADAVINREINRYYTEMPYEMEFERGNVRVRK